MKKIKVIYRGVPMDISQDVADRLNLKEGDTITLEMMEGLDDDFQPPAIPYEVLIDKKNLCLN